MDLGYAQTPVLLIWQSSDRINIGGVEEGSTTMSFFVLCIVL